MYLIIRLLYVWLMLRFTTDNNMRNHRSMSLAFSSKIAALVENILIFLLNRLQVRPRY